MGKVQDLFSKRFNSENLKRANQAGWVLNADGENKFITASKTVTNEQTEVTLHFRVTIGNVLSFLQLTNEPNLSQTVEMEVIITALGIINVAIIRQNIDTGSLYSMDIAEFEFVGLLEALDKHELIEEMFSLL